jgi:hypothetical protein
MSGPAGNEIYQRLKQPEPRSKGTLSQRFSSQRKRGNDVRIWLLSWFILMSLAACTVDKQADSVGDIAIEYANKCGGCHGKLGQGGVAPSHIDCSLCDSVESLYLKIDDGLSPHDKIYCRGMCAQNMAIYIYEALNGKEQ